MHQQNYPEHLVFLFFFPLHHTGNNADKDLHVDADEPLSLSVPDNDNAEEIDFSEGGQLCGSNDRASIEGIHAVMIRRMKDIPEGQKGALRR